MKIYVLILLLSSLILADKTIEEEINQKRKELFQLEEKIEEKKKEKKEIEHESSNIKKELNKDKIIFNKIKKNYQLCNKELKVTYSYLKIITTSILEIEAQIQNNKYLLISSLNSLYKHKRTCNNLVYFWPMREISSQIKMKLIRLMIEHQNKKLEEKLETKEEKKKEEEEIKKRKELLENKKLRLHQTSQKLDQKILSEITFLNKIKEQEKNITKTIEKLKKEKTNLETLIMDLKKQNINITSDFYKMQKRLIWPINTTKIYSGQYKTNSDIDIYKGIILEGEENENVIAVYKGKVIFANVFKNYGKVVIIDHGGGYYTLYAQLKEILVQKGQKIKEKDVIGILNSKDSPFGSKLYFEIRREGIPLDPLLWLKE